MEKQKNIFKIFIFIELVLVFFLFLNVSKKLNLFIDEYISLASNTSFFKNLDFNGGAKTGGSYSVMLTSGPLSAVGSVIGWNVSKNLFVARFFNFIWAMSLHLIFINYIKKYYEINKDLMIIFSIFSLVLIPWFFGVLYSIGEITSTIFSFYSILMFPHNRKFSLVLFSLSIFYGKLILIVIFGVFYLTYIYIHKEYRKIVLDFLLFSFPAIIWLLLVSLFYKNGSVINYAFEFFNFNLINNQSAGFKELGFLTLRDYFFSFQNSEVMKWSLADILRVLFSPLIFSFIFIYSYKNLNIGLQKIVYPVLLSSNFLYLWFWLLSPTKWIRYSQHFLLLQMLFLFFYLSQKNLKIRKFKISLITIYLLVFMSSTFLILVTLTLLIGLLIFDKFKLDVNINYFICFFLIINLLNLNYEYSLKQDYNFNFIECKERLNSFECYLEYTNQ
tara:strand:- start:370 stop:1701 length:1332 start_codon:yes stop_codon:yes gene_type:complete